MTDLGPGTYGIPSGSTINQPSGDVIGPLVEGGILTVPAPPPPESFVLTVNTIGTGAGTVTGAGVYQAGMLANPSATPAAGSTFDGWDQPVPVLMDADKTITATFTLIPIPPPTPQMDLSLDHDGGNGLAAETVLLSDTHAIVYLKPDPVPVSDGRNPWTFLIDAAVKSGARGKSFHFEFHYAHTKWQGRQCNAWGNLDLTSTPNPVGGDPLWYQDGLGSPWKKLTGAAGASIYGEAGQILHVVTPALVNDSFRVASYPFYEEYETDRQTWLASRFVTEVVLGQTVHGRPVRMYIITDPDTPLASKSDAYMVTTYHHGERWAIYQAVGAINWLISTASDAVAARQTGVWHVIPIAVPDAHFEGLMRCNAEGIEQNRFAVGPASVAVEGSDSQYFVHRYIDALMAGTGYGPPLKGLYDVHLSGSQTGGKVLCHDSNNPILRMASTLQAMDNANAIKCFVSPYIQYVTPAMGAPASAPAYSTNRIFHQYGIPTGLHDFGSNSTGPAHTPVSATIEKQMGKTMAQTFRKDGETH